MADGCIRGLVSSILDATGRDPRHSLVRVEIADPSLATGQIDAISAWVLAERIPRATADSRWATLLYPIYYLEQILKRYIETRNTPLAWNRCCLVIQTLDDLTQFGLPSIPCRRPRLSTEPFPSRTRSGS